MLSDVLINNIMTFYFHVFRFYQSKKKYLYSYYTDQTNTVLMSQLTK